MSARTIRSSGPSRGEIDLVPSRALRLSTERHQLPSLVLASAVLFAVISLAGLARPPWHSVIEIQPPIIDLAPPMLEPRLPDSAPSVPVKQVEPEAAPIVVPDRLVLPEPIREVLPGSRDMGKLVGPTGREGGSLQPVAPCVDCEAPIMDPKDQPYVDYLPVELNRVPPQYPPFARDVGAEGTVALWALVGTDGRVQDVRILKSSPLFDDSARSAVSLWRFVPASTNGHAVRAWVAVRVRFHLH